MGPKENQLKTKEYKMRLRQFHMEPIKFKMGQWNPKISTVNATKQFPYGAQTRSRMNGIYREEYRLKL